VFKDGTSNQEGRNHRAFWGTVWNTRPVPNQEDLVVQDRHPEVPEMPEPHDLAEIGRPLEMPEMRRHVHGRCLHAHDDPGIALRARNEAQGARNIGVISSRGPPFSHSLLWCVLLENLGDFVFSIRFTIKDDRFVKSIPKLLGLELGDLGGSSGRIHDLQILDDGKGNVTIQARANDMTGFKIAANSINRYIEIIGKVVEMVQKGLNNSE